MHEQDIAQAIPILQKELERREWPIVSQLAKDRSQPFLILISTLLSLRTKDEVTAQATEKLFSLARTPAEMLGLSPEMIEQAIYPVGFYHNKARTIIAVSRELIDRHHSQVPDTMEQLLALPGVGRKTANLVLILGFDKEGICVDTHVHRISNRWGYVRTKTPEQTEFALREKLPRQYWKEINTLMVAFGRRTCLPVSPLCSGCPLRGYCDRVGVKRSR